jgi:HAMP domain-containing protein
LIVVAGGVLFALTTKVRSLLFDTEVEKLRPAARELAKLCADYYMSPSEGKLRIGFAKIVKDFPDVSYLLFRDVNDGVHWYAESANVAPVKNHAASLDPRLKPVSEIELPDETYVDVGGVTDTLPRLPVHVGFPKTILQRQLRSFLWNKGAIALLVVAGGLMGGVLLSVWLTHPVVKLSSLAERMSLGDMDVRLDLKYKGEIGKVYHSLERLRESVLYALRRLNGKDKATKDRTYVQGDR